MKTRCMRSRFFLPAVLDGARPSRHTATCLTCQAEASRYRAMGRRLHDLRNELIAAPAGVAVAVAASLDGPMAPSSRSHVFDGAAAAAAAGAALVVAWAVTKRLRKAA